MDSVTEIRNVNEAVNPDVHRSVNSFIKKMANKYNYPLQSAVYAIMSVLRSQKYKGLSETNNLEESDIAKADYSAWNDKQLLALYKYYKGLNMKKAVASIGQALKKRKVKTEAITEERLNEGNSYYDLKVQYYEIADNHGHGGLLSTLHDIKKKADTEEMDKIGGIDAEIKIWTAIHKLVNKSKLGKIL